ncbi:hypothetical protein B0H14DRAFT_3431100 [Mycena olivaceomarginata]|nr:hypothetical protein B0H14DRAFT_3431100 [Mycena olivaceomarginata]
MVGGRFWDDQLAEPSIGGLATGYFLVLSALLAEATSDPLYLQAATESVDFIHSHLYNVQNIVQQYISSTGYFNSLDGLMTAVIPHTGWQGDDGIDAADGKIPNLSNSPYAYFDSRARREHESDARSQKVYARNSTNSTLRQYVGDYIAVQFNAVIDLATSSGTNIYGGSWTGPPGADFSAKNQTTALAALISALGVATTLSSPPSQHPPKLAAIVGGTLGGLAIVGLGLALT